jgi:hypothetical protein
MPATKTKKTVTAKAKSAKATKAVAEKKTKESKAKKPKAEGKLSALDAAAKVLSESREPLTTGEMIEAMAAKGYWTSPGGKTPERTLNSAILRELNLKRNESRFVKTERGRFAAKK